MERLASLAGTLRNFVALCLSGFCPRMRLATAPLLHAFPLTFQRGSDTFEP